MDSKTKETLEKQLQLLSERSENVAEPRELAELTEAVVMLSTELEQGVK